MALDLVLEPEQLAQSLGDDKLLIVDLCNPQTSAAGQVPGALRLEYASLVASRAPVGGLLPDAAQLSSVFSTLAAVSGWVFAAAKKRFGGARSSSSAATA